MISNTNILSKTSVNNTNATKQKQNPHFKGVASSLVNVAGSAMSKIENGGFVASFLIQDTLGMTVPRTEEGLFRDRDKKNTKFKDLNFKEAAEVFIREFLSGPIMMFTPFIVFGLTKKHLGKSTFSNTGLIKNLGKSFKNVVKESNANNVSKTAKDLTENFYHSTLHAIIEKTTPKAEHVAKNKFVNDIVSNVKELDELNIQLKNAKGISIKDKFLNIFKNKNNKVVSEKKQISNKISEINNYISNKFNNFHKENSSELELLNKVKLGKETYKTSETIEAMQAYAHDISKSSTEKMTEAGVDAFGKSAMTKRILSTGAASVATIGSTSLVPSIYALLNPVAPGAMSGFKSSQEPIKEHTTLNPKEKTDNKKNNVSFKGNILKQLQFNGNQLTPVLMTTLAITGLVAPRVNTAIKRAPKDEDGKKNLIEVPEILFRDSISIAAVTCGEPMLTKAMVNAYEDKSGFVLQNRPKEKMSMFKKVLNTLNPLGEVHPFANSEIKEIYGNITNHKKLTNFAQFINQNDGDLFKVLSNLDNAKEVFAGTEADFNLISKLDRKSSNSRIMKTIENFAHHQVTKLMEPAKKGKPNGMLLKARNLNALPRFINTIVLIPVFLGVVLPKMTYALTAKNRRKMVEESLKNHPEKQLTSTSTVQPTKTNITNETFNKLKHNK